MTADLGGVGLLPASAAETGTERPSDVVVLPDTQRNDFVERAWRLCCSTKLMVVLMALFIAGMAAGTFLNPKDDALADIERVFADRPWVLWAYHTFELYAPFKSWWFTAIILALALNNLASSIERLPRIFLIVKYPERKLTDTVLRGLRNKRTVPRAGLSADTIEAGFRSAGYHVSQVVEGGTTYVFGERGAWARFGVWVVHVALLVICFGGILSRFLAFEGTMQIPGDGGHAASFQERMPDGVIIRHPLSFILRCDQFHLDKFKDGSARRYASDVTVLSREGKELYSKHIIVNDPLDWDGMKFYQATYTERPDLSHAVMQLTDNKTGETREIDASAGTPFTAGDGHIRYSVEKYEENFGELGPAVQVVREEDVGPGKDPKLSSFFVFSKYPEFDAKFRGDRYGLRFDRLEPSYVTGIQVASDPGRIWMYAGAIMMWIGLFIAFWTVHRRVWARIDADSVVFAGAAHRNKEKFREEFDRFIDGLLGKASSRDAS
jgi:cytochrome c biogenesis protein